MAGLGRQYVGQEVRIEEDSLQAMSLLAATALYWVTAAMHSLSPDPHSVSRA